MTSTSIRPPPPIVLRPVQSAPVVAPAAKSVQVPFWALAIACGVAGYMLGWTDAVKAQNRVRAARVAAATPTEGATE